MIRSTDPAQDSIGVFDSGIGGLSVLRALRAVLPSERFVYWADNGHAPYGERGDAFVRLRSHAVVEALRAAHPLKAIVVACNTATAAAIESLRQAHPDIPIVGIEPALKPAALESETGHIGVLATRGTLGSARFAALAQRVASTCQLHLQPCDGLADAIERWAEHDNTQVDSVQALIDRHVTQLGPLGSAPGQIDSLVLGCTHYPLAWTQWTRRVGAQARLIDPAAAVARQLQRVLSAADMLNTLPVSASHADLTLLTTGHAPLLHAAVRQWLQPGSVPSPQDQREKQL